MGRDGTEMGVGLGRRSPGQQREQCKKWLVGFEENRMVELLKPCLETLPTGGFKKK